ncbi:MAG: peroxiredoxin [Alphaproteobacteria bacterium]
MTKNLPTFSLPDQDNHIRTSDEFMTNWLVLYFYPKDNTSGCTLEANDFQKHLNDFTKKQCQIVGVSRDSVRSHQKFYQQQSLAFTLLSDENNQLCDAMKTWVEKSMYGRKYMGIERSTFLYKNGILAKEWRKVKVPNHVMDVLASIDSN